METTEEKQKEEASGQSKEAQPIDGEPEEDVQLADEADAEDDDAQEERSTRKERVGIVTSDKMQKSIVVAVQRQVKHSMYDKFMKRTSKIMAHDENDDAGEGDTVRIMECRPYSKRKRWRLTDIIERAK